jgi:hypothetical protein
VVALVLLLLAAGGITTALRGTSLQPGRLSHPPRTLAVPGLPQVGELDHTAAVELARSTPVELRIPAIDLAVPVSTLGLNRDGTVEVPTDFSRPGWFRLGPTPGEIGSAVILGHVDSRRGPAVFFRLQSLRHGDQIEVSLADGTVARFVVSAVLMYPKDAFPAALVYGSQGYSGLRLVTCGGDFDAKAHSYRSNVVAYASLVGAHSARVDRAVE